MKVVTVVGARPQFVKAAAVSPVLRKNAVEVLVHTGQHYDTNMSQVFFDELALAEPDYNLGIGSGSHGEQTGWMLEAIEGVLEKEKPDWVLVYGDTNSTLAGALAAVKLHMPVAHVEAGLRSYNRRMPEEINRVLTDHAADRLFAPTRTAMANLAQEGLTSRAVLTGDVMADILLRMKPRLRDYREILTDWGVRVGEYFLLTLHRPGNVDNTTRLREILVNLGKCETTVLFPVHPRTKARIQEANLQGIIEHKPFKVIPAVGYLEMLVAEANAKAVLTDSGGVQKEAYLMEVPCITLREETEWVETVETGWNALIGKSLDTLSGLVLKESPKLHPPLFGDGCAAEAIIKAIMS